MRDEVSSYMHTTICERKILQGWRIIHISLPQRSRPLLPHLALCCWVTPRLNTPLSSSLKCCLVSTSYVTWEWRLLTLSLETVSDYVYYCLATCKSELNRDEKEASSHLPGVHKKAVKESLPDAGDLNATEDCDLSKLRFRVAWDSSLVTLRLSCWRGRSQGGDDWARYPVVQMWRYNQRPALHLPGRESCLLLRPPLPNLQLLSPRVVVWLIISTSYNINRGRMWNSDEIICILWFVVKCWDTRNL